MKKVARTNDMVRMSFLRALLTDAGIEHVVLDTHMSITEERQFHRPAADGR